MPRNPSLSRLFPWSAPWPILLAALLALAVIAPGTPAQAQSGPALTLTPNKTMQSPGKPILANWTAANQGKKKQSFYLRFLLSDDAVAGPDDKELNSVLVRDLAAGQSATGTAPLRLPVGLSTGPMHLLLVATPLSDAGKYLAQTGAGITVTTQAALPTGPGDLGAGQTGTTSQTGTTGQAGTAGQPSPYYTDTTPGAGSGCDLTPIWLSMDPEQPRPGDTVRVTYQVMNQGAQTCPAGEVEVYLGPSPVLAAHALSYVTIPLPSLGSGLTHAGEAKAPLDANLAPGTWYLGFIVDPMAQIPETNENNNVRSLPIIVP